jgi:hypothetical protein
LLNNASLSNGSSGFKVTGVCPLNQNVCSDHFFSTADNPVIPSVEIKPQFTASTSEKSRDPEPSVSLATDEISHTLETAALSTVFSLLCACNHIPLVSNTADFVITAEELPK